EGGSAVVERESPPDPDGSLAAFHGATYTKRGIYTQSVRFDKGGYRYTVFTETRGMEDLDAGVRVRDLETGKVTTVHCSERPRFYIFELQHVLACDPETPDGKACIQ